jgi:hypothetical protein
MVSHVTQSELAHHLSLTESHNGFANRCLWISVRRSQSLPDGRSLPLEEWAAVAREVRRALDWVHSQSGIVFRRTAAARELWNDRYPVLSESRPDVYGAATTQRISEALDATPEGLTRTQIRGLFRRHIGKERIDLALEQLSSLGLINRRTAARAWTVFNPVGRSRRHQSGRCGGLMRIVRLMRTLPPDAGA